MNRGPGRRRADDEELSQNPTDRLIRDLIAQRRQPTESETAQIVKRVSAAEFDSRMISVPDRVRPHAPRGMETWDALSLHVAQRVELDNQWAEGTTSEMFVGDLRAAARDPSARIALYEARGGYIALVVADSRPAVPVEHLGNLPEPLLVVVYSADLGVIVSGYQASSFDRIRIGDNAVWLR